MSSVLQNWLFYVLKKYFFKNFSRSLPTQFGPDLITLRTSGLLNAVLAKSSSESWLFLDVHKDHAASFLEVLPKLVLYYVSLDGQKGKDKGIDWCQEMVVFR